MGKWHGAKQGGSSAPARGQTPSHEGGESMASRSPSPPLDKDSSDCKSLEQIRGKEDGEGGLLELALRQP